jgi:RTX calcium-binding nonapeptide repeat (4 copies)
MPAPRLLSLTAAATLFGAALILGPGAEAAVHTSTGLRCTIVGKPGPDHLRGTAHHDVICGLGGNDVIDGLGGNDVVDGGAGNDTLVGGAGNDRLLGGVGNDVLTGQAGNDSITAATGNDRVDAGAGNDVVSAGAGNDTVASGTGNDRVSGGAGNDTETGSTGNDVLLGESGNDDLSGQAGNDTVNGGSGTNWCDAAGGDAQTACKTDTEHPEVHELELSPSTVDVTDHNAVVIATYHVTDDTGVRQTAGGPTLVRGTIRDGWWSWQFSVPRYAVPQTRDYTVNVTDRVGHSWSKDFPGALTILDAHPDLQTPVVQSLTVSPSTVDVRSAAKTVTGTVRITDDRAGVGRAYLCPAHLFADGFRQAGACEWLYRVSGTPQNGLFRASVAIPRGAVGGQWNFEVWVEDASENHDTQYCFGPDEDQWRRTHDQGDPWWTTLPNGAGRFTVLGTTDNNAPQLSSMTLSPSTVDVSTHDQTVTFDVAATDVEGITGLGAWVHGSSDFGTIDVGTDEEPDLVSGTPQNGVWRLHIPIAQGTPPGTYVIQLWIEDKTHFNSWFSPGSDTYDSSQQVFTPEQTPNGAVITVQ